MYGFHKIKNDRGVHEFRHPSFKKGHYDDLANIKRKNITNQKGEEHQEKELDTDEYNKLRETLEHTKASLESITQQNINLITANKEVAGRLYNFKHDYEAKLKKLFFMFYFLINSKDARLLEILKKLLTDFGLAFDSEKSKNYEEQTAEIIDHINRKILINSNSEQIVVTKLLNAFTEYISTAGYFDEEINLKPLETGVVDNENGYDRSAFEFQYITSPRKSIQSLNVNLKSETISECDFSGHNSIMQKSPLLRFDVFDTRNHSREFDLERLMVPVSNNDSKLLDDSVNNHQGFSKRPLYDV